MSSIQNASNFYNSFEQSGAFLPGIKYPSGFSGNLASGDVTLYTVPAGRKAIVLGCNFYNPSGGTIIFYFKYNLGGTSYRASANTSANTLTNSGAQPSTYILEAGDYFIINSDNSGGNIFPRIVEFDASAAIKSSKVAPPASGDNTIYTCPTGKTALVLANNIAANPTIGVTYFINDSGGALNLIVYSVPNGGSTGSTNQVRTTISATDKAVQAVSINSSMAAGDFIVQNLSGAGTSSLSWVNVIEVNV